MNALVHQETRALGVAHTFDDMERMAAVMAQSGLFGVKNPVQALALMLVAQAEGEHPASVAQDYDVIQGKGTRKTHSVLARFQAMGGKVEWHELTHTRAEATFSHPKGGSLRLDWTIEQAKQAKLTGKDNWQGYARAMLRARLIAEGVRSVYPAAIGGWQVPEEAAGPQLDAQPAEKHMGPADVVQPEVQPYPQEQFDKNLPAWLGVIAKGKKTVDDIIAMANTKAPLTDAQKATLAERAKASTEPAKDAPKVTADQVAERIRAATNLDQLAEAGSLIAAVPDEHARAELTAAYEEAGYSLSQA